MLNPGALLRALPDHRALPAVDASALASLGVAGYLIGLALPGAAAVDLPLAFLVILVVAAALAGLRHRPAPPRSLIAIPLLAFVAARLVSALTGPQAFPALPVIAPLLPALLVFFALSEWVRTRGHVVAVYASLTASGLILSTTFLAAAWRSGPGASEAWALAAPSALLVVKNDVTVVAVMAPLALAAALARPHPLVRLLVAAFFAALAAVIGIAQSRTALVTAIVAVASFAVLTKGRAVARSRGAWLAVAGGLALVVAVDAALGFRLAHKVLGDWQGNGRFPLWAAALAMFQDAPVLGQGPHGFMLHQRAYLEALQLPGWLRVDDRVIPWAHNLYLELLAEQGALGLATFLGLVAAAAATLVRIQRTRHADVRLLGAGVGAALVAFLTAAAIELSLVRAWVTIILFTLLGLVATITRVEQGSRA